MSPVITLLTDFGGRDAFVGVMKGVLLTRVPGARIVDLCHELEPGDRLAAAFNLRGALPWFPPGTVHVVVVDPGVGSSRRILAARLAGQTVLAPDNGLLAPLLDAEAGAEVRAVERPEWRSERVSRTFHGRDVFAPAAAALATGSAFADAGPVVEPVRDSELWPAPRRTADGGAEGEVLYVDRFGNLIANLPGEWLEGDSALRVEVAGRDVGPLRGSYSAVAPGQPLALIDSFDLLEVSIRNGNAAQRLGVGRGTAIRVRQNRK